jgi:predicted enzyme related to lactoylglutathione lyase
MGNRVAYFEVAAGDNQPLIAFYRDLFGWQMQEIGESYALVDTAGRDGINGGIGRSGDGTPWVSFYVKVDDLQETLDGAVAAGGSELVPVTEIEGFGSFAMFRDPDGNPVGLVGASTMGGPSAGHGSAVDWFEVLGSEPQRTQRFYADLFGWKLDDSGFPGYALVDTDSGEGSIGGGIGGGLESGSIRATVYANVPDAEAALARAEELGGTRVYGPDAVDDHMKTGAFRDPAGNVFGVYEHHHE